jgi:hypothetical protein
MSLVMRGAGVGEGDGDGTGAGAGGVNFWAAAGNERLEAANPATPSAGSSFTNARRSTPPALAPSLLLFDRFDSVCFFFIGLLVGIRY